MRSKTAIALSAELAGAATLALCALAAPAGASAPTSSIALRGPHVNRYGVSFQYVASGFARGRANYVAGFESAAAVSCAGTYRAEALRAGASRVLRQSLARNKRFTFTVPFFASKVGAHRLCAYVTNKGSGKTFARAHATWRNSAGSLQPAPVGRSDCGARRFADGSVYAQVAVSGVSCELVESVAFGADAAKGAPYGRAGLSCTATAEGAGSMWATAWTGAYYAYACAAGNELAAFNWGQSYAYGPTANLPLVNPGG
jgi:hypothetical protein